MWTILKGAREFLKEVQVAIFWEAIQLAPKLIIWAGAKIILWTFLKGAKEFLQEMLGEGGGSQPAGPEVHGATPRSAAAGASLKWTGGRGVINH